MSLTARLRHRVEIQERIESQDSETGDVTHEWVPLQIGSSSSSQPALHPAEVFTGAGREFNGAGAKQAETDARMTLRWFPGLDYAHRIVWQSKNYDITSIETDVTGRKEYRLRCKEGASNGG